MKYATGNKFILDLGYRGSRCVVFKKLYIPRDKKKLKNQNAFLEWTQWTYKNQTCNVTH